MKQTSQEIKKDLEYELSQDKAQGLDRFIGHLLRKKALEEGIIWYAPQTQGVHAPDYEGILRYLEKHDKTCSRLVERLREGDKSAEKGIREQINFHLSDCLFNSYNGVQSLFLAYCLQTIYDDIDRRNGELPHNKGDEENGII